MKPAMYRARSLLPLLLAAAPVAGQTAPTYPTRFTAEVAAEPAIRAALQWIEDHFDEQVEEWIRITEMPAKSGSEAGRAAYVKAQLEALGLTVTIDSIGNVTAVRPGTGGGETVVLAAHLDTVHPLDTDVSVTRDGDVLRAPGVFDNSASVANMLALARALHAADVRTRGDIVLIGTVHPLLRNAGEASFLGQVPAVLRSAATVIHSRARPAAG